MSTAAVQYEAPWRAGIRSAKANALPGFALQLLALVLLTAYYQHEGTRAALDRLALWREHAGVGVSVLSTGFFGGVVPMLYLRARRSTRLRFTWMQGAVLTAFWSYKGFEIDLLYRLLARFVGSGNDVSTVAIKTVFDQFFYGPVFAVPVTVLVYGWVGAHFNVGTWLAEITSPGWIRRKIVPLLISNTWVWLPTVCIIYALPTGLQLPMQNIVLCFYTLLVAHQSRA